MSMAAAYHHPRLALHACSRNAVLPEIAAVTAGPAVARVGLEVVAGKDAYKLGDAEAASSSWRAHEAARTAVVVGVYVHARSVAAAF